MKRAVLVALSCVLLVLGMLTPNANGEDSTDPWFTDVTVTNATFYPLYDGYKDVVNATWVTATAVDQGATCGVSVYDSTGALVPDSFKDEFSSYSCEYSSDRQGSVQWGGRKAPSPNAYPGAPFPAGEYTIVIDYRDQWGTLTHTLTIPVTIASGSRWVHRKVSVDGRDYDHRVSSDRCRVHRISRSAFLDCWGKGSAKVDYSLFVDYQPSQWKDFKWWIDGDVGCCTRGMIRKWATRTRHNLHIYVKVTKWRSYTVNSVGFSFWSKERI